MVANPAPKVVNLLAKWPIVLAFDMFSWAEFMANEPVNPKDRKRRPQPATASLFEWALTLEQEREAELLGAGR